MRLAPSWTVVMFLALGEAMALNEEQAAPATPFSLRTSAGKALLHGVTTPTISLASTVPVPRSSAYLVWR